VIGELIKQLIGELINGRLANPSLGLSSISLVGSLSSSLPSLLSNSFQTHF